jgi:pSer/pThr/pTyr-binding forkhead associated (FHA) protein
MNDGRTRKLELKDLGQRGGFLATHSAMLVIAAGPLGGSEFLLEKERVTLGRGPGVDLPLDDASVSHQHAALELAGAGFRVRDLGSTNGLRVNGSRVSSADLKHGDRLEIGALAFRYVVETRLRTPTHHVSED